ncbi:MAG TPA: ribosome biogenesis GTPase Der [Firmicutes bacterium]|nr:ribosome biogenesis GTPase Der [Bacillota bacterium]
MAKPLVAIIGRSNVGKSTFFNRVCGKRISIVKDTPGVTRDRIYADAEWCGKYFTLIDTGGIENDKASFAAEIRRQADIAMDLADVIIFMTDGKAGLLSSDREVAAILRTTSKPVVLAVNKLDNNETDTLYDFYELGLGEPFPVSCEQMLGIGDLLDEVVKHFPTVEEEEDRGLSIAFVGKPNVGKSSLVNRLLGFDRVIVSDVPGTTRDAIDTPFEYNGVKYTLIDTAGMRRKRGIEDESVERYGVMRSIAAIGRADVVFVVFDSSEPISEQDVRIAGMVHDEGKPSVIVMNKWDKVEKDTSTVNKFNATLAEKLNFMGYFRSEYVSALSGQRTLRLLDIAEEVHSHASMRVPTGVLNDVISDAVRATEPPSHSGRRLKILYATQVSVCPPTFVIFVNDEQLMHFSYKRYLENSLRRAFDFSGTPVRIKVTGKKEDE